MYKKLLISVSVIVAIIFSFSVCFANNMMNEAGNMLQDAGNNIRNIVGNAENAVEDTARNISGASKDATENITQKANNIGNEMMNSTNNQNNTEYNANFNNNTDNDYNATRVATTGTANNATFMGMDANMWTWLIVGIAAIAIISLIWYYTMQLRSNDNNRD